MERNNIPNIPKIKVTTIKYDEYGIPAIKQLYLPNGKIEESKTINNITDGIYYSVYEVCEVIDIITKNKYEIIHDTKTNKNYKLTEEIQYLLENVPQNLRISRTQLPGQNGYYIHERALKNILERLEKVIDVEAIMGKLVYGKGNIKKEEREGLEEKLRKAQEEYLQEDTKPRIFKKIQEKITSPTPKGWVVILALIATVIILISKPHSPEPPENIYQIQIQELLDIDIPNPDISNITLYELCKTIEIGKNYKIPATKLYESSDHNGRQGITKPGNYTISMIAVIDKDNVIHTLDSKNNKNQTIIEGIEGTIIRDSKLISAAISTQEGAIIGWIDVSKENFKELAEQIAINKNPPQSLIYTITTKDPNQFIHPETGEVLEITSNGIYDNQGNKEEDIKVLSIKDSEGNIIELETKKTKGDNNDESIKNRQYSNSRRK